MRVTSNSVKVFAKMILDEDIMTEAKLNDIERFVLREHWKEEKTFQKIGRNEGLTKERIRQIHDEALQKVATLLLDARRIGKEQTEVKFLRTLYKYFTPLYGIKVDGMDEFTGKQKNLLQKLGIVYLDELKFYNEHNLSIQGYGEPTIKGIIDVKTKYKL